MNKNIVIGIVIIILVLIVIAVFLNIKPKYTERVIEKEDGTKKEILYVSSLSWKPFTYEEGGEFKGIGVDIMDRVLSNLNVDYEFSILPWSRVLKVAETGEMDAIHATHKTNRESYLAYTPEQFAYGREGRIPETYLHTADYVFFVRKIHAESFKFESIDQVTRDKYRVGINQDYSYTPKINNASWNTISHPDESESFKALERGEIDVFLANTEVGLEILNNVGLSDEITYIEKPVDTSYVFFVFSKNSDYSNVEELSKRFDEELKKIHESGEFDEIYRKYVLEGEKNE